MTKKLNPIDAQTMEFINGNWLEIGTTHHDTWYPNLRFFKQLVRRMKDTGEDDIVIAAACKSPDGIVYAVTQPGRHHHVNWAMAQDGLELMQEADQGFVTNLGKYLTREEAMVLVKKNKQECNLTRSEQLYSEDVWGGENKLEGDLSGRSGIDFYEMSKKETESDDDVVKEDWTIQKQIELELANLLHRADMLGYTIRVSGFPLMPPRMGNSKTVSEVRKKHVPR